MNVIATPTEGRRVRKEDGQLLAAGGEPVPRNSYWLRRQADGDVTLSDVPPAAATKPAPAKK